MAFFPRAFAVLLAGAVSAVASLAGAQTISLAKSSVQYDPPRSGVLLTQISYADCIGNVTISFPLTIGAASTLTLTAYVAASGTCDTEAARTGASKSCWLLYRTPVASLTNGNGNATVTLGVRDIISAIVTHPPDDPLPATPGAAPASVCEDTSTAGGPQQFTIYFSLFDSAISGAAKASDSWTGAAFDLVGPNPPTNVQALPGEGRVIVRFDATTGSSDLNGYNYYCNPLPGALPADAGASASDAGATCDTAPLVPDMRPDEAYYCGSSGSDQIKGLVDGYPYAVAVAARDLYGNVGPLSEASCATPEPVTGFFEAYRAAGGLGGGGYCSVGSKPSRGAALVLLSAGLLLIGRRRRAC